MGKRYNCILIKNMFLKFPFFTVSHRMFVKCLAAKFLLTPVVVMWFLCFLEFMETQETLR